MYHQFLEYTDYFAIFPPLVSTSFSAIITKSYLKEILSSAPPSVIVLAQISTPDLWMAKWKHSPTMNIQIIVYYITAYIEVKKISHP